MSDRLTAPQAEMTILGCLMVDPATIRTAFDALELGDFTFDSHRRIFRTMWGLQEAGIPIDLVSVANAMRNAKDLEAVGGVPYLSGLSEGLPRHLNITSYVKIVKEKTALRSIVALANVAIARAEEAEPSADILGDLQTGALAYQARTSELRATPIAELVGPAWQEIADQMASESETLGIPTGIRELDKVSTGWRDGEFTIVGAKPGMGKTSFMLQCMWHAAGNGYPVGCVSLEMRSSQLMRRLAIMGSGIHAGKWRDPRNIPEAERGYAKHAMYALADRPMWVADQSGLNARQIVTLARKMHAEGAKAIFIDFIQIIEGADRDQRVAINKVSAAIRDCCKELNVPFIVLSQLSRGDKTSDRKPTKEDFRESGNLEQDCHNAILLWREKDGDGNWTGNDLIIRDKAREGVLGNIPVAYDAATLTYKGRA